MWSDVGCDAAAGAGRRGAFVAFVAPEGQDRARWNAARTGEAVVVLDRAQRLPCRADRACASTRVPGPRQQVATKQLPRFASCGLTSTGRFEDGPVGNRTAARLDRVEMRGMSAADIAQAAPYDALAMARRPDRGRTASRRMARAVTAAILVCCSALFAAVPAQAAPPAWQRTVTLGNGAPYVGSGQGSAVSASPLILSTAAASAGANPEQARLCSAGTLDPAKTVGKIVVCDNGTTSPSDKSLTVENAGGVAMILVNVDAGPLTSDVLSVETIHVNEIAGAAIKAYIGGTAGATASLAAGQRNFAPSTTAVASSANPSPVGTAVTLTATVGAGSLEPTGSVRFTAGGTQIDGCDSVALAAGRASCTVSVLGAGAHSIEAAYSGDDGLNPSSGTLTQQVAVVIVVERPPQAGPPQTPAAVEPAISALRLGARCARRSRSGRVRAAMTMQLAQPAALQIVVERAVGSEARRTCPAPSSVGALPTRFRPAATVHRGVTGAGAPAAPRRLTLRLRLSPGLYRLTVRAQLADDALSRPVRGFLHVLR